MPPRNDILEVMRGMFGWRTVYFWNAVAAFLLLCIVIPWQPGVIEMSQIDRLRIDYSGLLVLFQDFGQSKRFGVDVVFPYGPFAFASYNLYSPHTFYWLLGLRMAMWLGFSAVLFRLSACVENARYRPIAYIIPLFVIAWFFSGLTQPAFLIAPILLAVLYVLDASSPTKKNVSASTFVFLLTCAIIALIKFNYFLLFSLFVVLFFLADVFVRRRLPVLSLTGALALPVLWLASGQHLTDFGAYVFTAFDLSRGFNLELSIGGLRNDLLRQALIISSSALLVTAAFAFWTYRRVPDWRFTAIISVGAAATSFLIYKYGVVRHDGHAGHAASAFAGLLAILFVLFVVEAATRVTLLVPAVMLLGLAFNLSVVRAWNLPLPIPSTVTHRVETGFAGMIRFEGERPIAARYAQAMGRMAGLVNIPKPDGSVDFVGNNPGIGIVSDWDLNHRPSFLNQQTVSEYSSRLNASFLDSASAPDNYVVQFSFSDSRYPAMSDPLIWRKLLSNYNVVAWPGNTLILRKKKREAQLSEKPLGTANGRFNTKILLPKSETGTVIWAKIDVELSLLGNLANFLYKAPVPSFTVHLANGLRETYRYVHYAGDLGFILSPTLTNAIPFVTAAGKNEAMPPSFDVDSISVDVPEKWLGFFQDGIKIRFFALEMSEASPIPDAVRQKLEDHTEPRSSSVGEERRMFSLARLKDTAAVKVGTSLLNFRFDAVAGKHVLFSHAPQTMRRKVPELARWLTIGFGMMETSYSHENEGDGASIVVRGRDKGGSWVILFRRSLNPLRNKEDRGEQFADIDLRGQPFLEVSVEFNVNGQPAADHTFISEFLFR